MSDVFVCQVPKGLLILVGFCYCYCLFSINLLHLRHEFPFEESSPLRKDVLLSVPRLSGGGALCVAWLMSVLSTWLSTQTLVSKVNTVEKAFHSVVLFFSLSSLLQLQLAGVLGPTSQKKKLRLGIKNIVQNPRVNKLENRAGEMSQRLRAPTALPQVLSSNPSNHMVAHNHL